MNYTIDTGVAEKLDARIVEPDDWCTEARLSIHGPGMPQFLRTDLYDDDQYNFSFSTQLASVQEHLQAEADRGVDPVKPVYFYTANSAAPLAHTLRGFFDAQDSLHPPITHIDSHRRIDRLSRVMSHLAATHVVVIDQYVNKGKTLSDAVVQFIEMGLPPSAIMTIGTRLYTQLYEDGKDASNCHFANLDPATNWLAGRFYQAGRTLGALTAAATTQIAV